MTTVRTGLDAVLDDSSRLRGKRIGLLTNPSGIDARLRSTVDLLLARPEIEIVALFGPEHGVRGEAQAGEHVASSTDHRTGIPAHSLYGESRRPAPEVFAGLDLLLVDLQDIGVRFTTYISTVAHVLDVAHEAGVDVVILDRPNPWSGLRIDGNLLQPAFSSFVGIHTIPVLHGLTIGEFSRLWAAEHNLLVPDVIPMSGWTRRQFMDQTGLPWVSPSPNLPTLDSVIAFPATCVIEGTTLSEGRGTTRPFELFGAPWIDPEELRTRLHALGEPGCGFRSAYFTPWFSKHAGVRCGGVQLYVLDRDAFAPTRLAVRMLAVLRDLSPDEPFWLEPTAQRYFIDLLLGSDHVRTAIDNGRPLSPIVDQWQQDRIDFMPRFDGVRLY